MSTDMPYFKAYSKEIFFDLRACSPDDAPLVFYLAMVVWADQGIDPNDTFRVEKLRKMLGWRKDNFKRGLAAYLEICEQIEGKRLPKFLSCQLQNPAPKIQKHSVDISKDDVDIHRHSQTLPEHSQTFTDIQKNAPKSNESSRALIHHSHSHSQKSESRAESEARARDALSSSLALLEKCVIKITGAIVDNTQTERKLYEAVGLLNKDGITVEQLEQFAAWRTTPPKLQFLVTDFRDWLIQSQIPAPAKKGTSQNGNAKQSFQQQNFANTKANLDSIRERLAGFQHEETRNSSIALGSGVELFLPESSS